MIKTQHDDLRRFLYTPIEEAIELLKARQKQDLKLPDFDIPEPLRFWKDKPRLTAILARNIATPNYEIRRIVELCEKYQLELLIMTFQEDKFSSNNACKYALGRMGFFEGLGRNGGKKIRYNNVVNFNQSDGHTLRDCKTFRAQSLVKFHQDLLLQEFPHLGPDNIFDNSEWFIRHGTKTGNFYLENLKIFIKHAILFETFVLSGSELEFTMTNVLPAFQETIDNFGIKPLIVHSEDPNMEGDQYWQLYPPHLQALSHYDRRRTPRYDAPFDQFAPSEVQKPKLLR